MRAIIRGRIECTRGTEKRMPSNLEARQFDFSEAPVKLKGYRMSSQYENLVKCCGGVITPESIAQFQRAMIEPGRIIIEVIERAPGDL